MSTTVSTKQKEVNEAEIRKDVFKQFVLGDDKVYEFVYLVDEVRGWAGKGREFSDVEKVVLKMLADDKLLEEKRMVTSEGRHIGVGITQKGIEVRDNLFWKVRRGSDSAKIG